MRPALRAAGAVLLLCAAGCARGAALRCEDLQESRELCEWPEHHGLACVWTADGACVAEFEGARPRDPVDEAWHNDPDACLEHWHDGLEWARGRCQPRRDRLCHRVADRDDCRASRGCGWDAGAGTGGACVPRSYSDPRVLCPHEGAFGTPCYRDALYVRFLALEEWCPADPAEAALVRGMPGRFLPCSVFGFEACAAHCLGEARRDKCHLVQDAAEFRTCVATGCLFHFDQRTCARRGDCAWDADTDRCLARAGGAAGGADHRAEGAVPYEAEDLPRARAGGAVDHRAPGAGAGAGAGAGRVPLTSGDTPTEDRVVTWVLSVAVVLFLAFLGYRGYRDLEEASEHRRRRRRGRHAKARHPDKHA